ncbi:DUF3995 domain-containing protein [Kriegella aquimaris]|uniref:DUF3995 domain-containing protein n=1 Tax=Kriegella aquimaris TaxID=192904 RepID=A0A1G9R8M8_9FLAO|nr:DUF3995 domain-containing protein [Kriegella aquimaris]SDM19187.1 Protein of unknown function [Kriegella aquimaris]
MDVVSILLIFIFIILAGIHFNWALGGKWGIDITLPTTAEGQRVLNPKKIESAIVGMGLLSFGLFYLFRLELMPMLLPGWTIKYIGWLVPLIFLARAIGDFKYVGFFRKIKNTAFSKADAKYFSPLCALIGLLALGVQITGLS